MKGKLSTLEQLDKKKFLKLLAVGLGVGEMTKQRGKKSQNSRTVLPPLCECPEGLVPLGTGTGHGEPQEMCDTRCLCNNTAPPPDKKTDLALDEKAGKPTKHIFMIRTFGLAFLLS